MRAVNRMQGSSRPLFRRGKERVARDGKEVREYGEGRFLAVTKHARKKGSCPERAPLERGGEASPLDGGE